MNPTQHPIDPDELDAVVDRAVDGDQVALARLLERIYPVVVRYCRTRLTAGHRGLSGADDVAQEVSMAILTALPNYRREGRPFLAFVYGICSHKVADAHRAATRSKTHPVADLPETASADRDPEQLAVEHSVSATMAAMMDILPETQQEVLRLRIAVGLSAEETAEALGTTAGAVRVAQHRALNKLRGLLAEDAGLVEQLI